MKKAIILILGGAASLTLSLVLGINAQSRTESLNGLFEANVEALARNEGGGSYDCCNTCSGAFCGYFVPAGSTSQIAVYYK